jgi:hypothetical protein
MGNCICTSLNTLNLSMQTRGFGLAGLDYTAFVSLKGGAESMFLWDMTMGGTYDGFKLNWYPNSGFSFDFYVNHVHVFTWSGNNLPAWSDGNWHTWVFKSSVADNLVTCYFDGKPLFTLSMSLSLWTWVPQNSKGNAFTPYFDCYVDDIGFVSRKMTDAEILHRFGPGGIGLDTSLLTAQGFYIDFNQSDLYYDVTAQFSSGSVLGWPGSNQVINQRTGEALQWGMSFMPTMAQFMGKDVQGGDVLVCGSANATIAGRLMSWMPDALYGNWFADDTFSGTPQLYANQQISLTGLDLEGDQRWWVANDGTPLPAPPVRIVKNLAMLFSRWDW